MTEKELRRLGRSELLELLLVQTREVERLKTELAEAKAQLDSRLITVQSVGNLAEAVLALNGVAAATQAAANQYLENIAAMEIETKARCEKMLDEARREAETIRSIKRGMKLQRKKGNNPGSR